MYMQLKKYDAAVTLIQDRLTHLPADFTLYGMLGTAHYRAGRETQAEETWERAIALNSANQQSYRVIASVLIENRLLERAAGMYRRGRIACNDPYLFTIELSQLLAASMDYAGATEEYLRWLQQNPAQIGFVQGRMSAFSYKDDGRAAAIATVRKALETRQDLRLYELLGWLHLEGKEYANAFDVYRHIDDLSKANGGAVLGFADRVFREHAYDAAALAYREALRFPLQPAQIPRAKYGYACALMELQATADSGRGVILSSTRPVSETRTRYEGAVAAFTALTEEYPRSEYSAKSLYQIGMVQLRQYEDVDSALRYFQQVLTEPAITPTGRYDVQLRIGEILVARADTVRAATIFSAVAGAPDATPDQNDEAQYRLAELALFNGRIDDAVRLLGTISLNVQHDYTNDALELQAFLQENVATAPEALRSFGRAEYLARQRKNTEAAAILEDIVQRFPSAGVADDALLRIGALLTAAGRYADAVSVYERLLADFQENSNQIDRALFRLGEVQQFGIHDNARAILAYERLLAERPQSILVHEARKRIRFLRGETL
jgi:tetratricopeptide (TPR) repeat protein